MTVWDARFAKAAVTFMCVCEIPVVPPLRLLIEGRLD